MKIDAYSYDANTGIFNGVVNAWEDPMQPGSYLLPANSTDVQPPAVKPGSVRVWDGNGWVYEAIAEAPPADPSSPTAEGLAHAARELRNAQLANTDWTQLPDVPMSGAKRAEFTAYRQALRNLPQQAGFPESITWPERPIYEKT